MPVSFQDQSLADVSSRAAAATATTFESCCSLLTIPDDEARHTGILGLSDQICGFSELLYRWHLAAGALLPAQAARLSNMDPTRRIPASEVARRLSFTTATAYDRLPS
jgi:hypothetical protein